MAPTLLLSLGQFFITAAFGLLIVLIFYIVWPREPGKQQQKFISIPELSAEKCFVFRDLPELHLTDFLPNRQEPQRLLVYPVSVPSATESKEVRANNYRDTEMRTEREIKEVQAQAQAAFRSGDRARAQQLSDRVKSLQAEHNQARHQASRLFYELNNDDKARPANEVDLHRQRKPEALEITRRKLADVKGGVHEQLVFITGKGIHSPGGYSVLTPAVISECQKWSASINCEPYKPNGGCVTVTRKIVGSENTTGETSAAPMEDRKMG